MEGEGPDSLMTVRQGVGCDPGEAVREGESLSQMSYIERALPDLISSGRPLTRRRTLGPVSDTVREESVFHKGDKLQREAHVCSLNKPVFCVGFGFTY